MRNDDLRSSSERHIARVSDLTRLQASAMEEAGSVPTTHWLETHVPKRTPAYVPPAKTLVHSKSHASGLVAPPRPTLARSFSLKELKNISQSVAKHEKIASKEKQKAEKILAKAEKYLEKGKLDKAETLKQDALKHQAEAMKHEEAARQEKSIVGPGSTLAKMPSLAVAGAPMQ